MPRFPLSTPAISAIPSSVYSPLAHRLSTFAGERFPFHVGDTWMEPPEGCRMEDLAVGAHPGMHRYPPVNGVPALVDALVAQAGERHGVPTTAGHVLVTAGATAGLASIAMAFVAPGDEVLLLAPYWPLISGIVRCVQGVPVPVPVLHDSTPTPEEVVEALRRATTSRTVAVYLNTPNNPTGRVLPREVIEAIVRFAEANDLWIWADDVYEELRYPGVPGSPSAADHVAARALSPDRTFSCHSFSKQAGMAGNRVGWIVGPEAGMAEVRKAALFTLYSAPTAAQLAALRTLGRASWLNAARAQYAQTGRKVAEILGVPTPEAGTFLFFDVAPHLGDRGLQGFLEDLVDEGVLVAPGFSFGPYPTWIRMCFTAVEPEATLRGATILARHLGR